MHAIYSESGHVLSSEGSMNTGQLILPEAKLYFDEACVYDAVYGRLLQTDPIGSKDDLCCERCIFLKDGNVKILKSVETINA